MKKISAEQLYEAMDGIGEDLLLRSEQTQGTKAAGMKRRTVRRVSLAVSALAAIVILGVVGLNTLRMGKDAATSSAPAIETHQTAGGADSKKAEKQEYGTVMESARDEAADAAMEEYAETEGLADKYEQEHFAYDGRVYYEAERVEDDGTIVGDYVTTIVTNVYEAQGIYADGAGSILGDVFLVNGRDEEEALCMINEEEGTVILFEAFVP